MKTITDVPALLLDDIDTKTLVITDLHLGLEYDIYKKGISIPSRIDKQKERILNLIENFNAERIVLLGDVKHNIPQISKNEKRNLPGFFETISRNVELKVVKGNHDGNIERFLNKEQVVSTKGFKIDKYYLTHGQTWPTAEITSCKGLIMGHLHPAIRFKDNLGYSSILPCWVKSKVNKTKLNEAYDVDNVNIEFTTIVPAFNKFINGRPLNNTEEKKLGPIVSNDLIHLDSSEIKLLDGTYLGKLKDLKQTQ